MQQDMYGHQPATSQRQWGRGVLHAGTQHNQGQQQQGQHQHFEQQQHQGQQHQGQHQHQATYPGPGPDVLPPGQHDDDTLRAVRDLPACFHCLFESFRYFAHVCVCVCVCVCTCARV